MDLRVLLSGLLLAVSVCAQPPVPSRWEGRVTGAIRGENFDLPVVIEIGEPLAYEKNPFHLYVGTKAVDRVGDFLLASASGVYTGPGPKKKYKAGPMGVYDETVARAAPTGRATLQYLKVTAEGDRVTAELTETQAAAAAAINGFTGPNVSAQEASDLMRGVHEALGPTEIFFFERGLTATLQFGAKQVTGSIKGRGRSATNTSSGVEFVGLVRAKRVE